MKDQYEAIRTVYTWGKENLNQGELILKWRAERHKKYWGDLTERSNQLDLKDRDREE